jgi:hypothetical protein
MAQRTEAQALGSQGQSLVAHIVNSSGDWIARAQDEDFGVDLKRSWLFPKLAANWSKSKSKPRSPWR